MLAWIKRHIKGIILRVSPSWECIDALSDHLAKGQASNQRVIKYLTGRINELEDTVNQLLVEDGDVAIVTSGMDCDCVEWENHVTVVHAHEADEYIKKEYEYADGPMSIVRMKPSEALLLVKTTRDRIANATEDGHPHSV